MKTPEEKIAIRVLEIFPAEAAVVQRIFNDCAGGAALKQMADNLNRERIPAPGGGRWGHSTLYHILHNEVYWTVPAAPPGSGGSPGAKPLIPATVAETVRIRLARRQEIYHGGLGSTLPLPGRLVCGHCGSALQPVRRSNRQITGYACPHSHRKGSGSCPARRVPRKPLETLLLKNIGARLQVGEELEMLTDLVNREISGPAADQAEKRAALEENLKLARRSIQNLEQALETGEVDSHRLAARLNDAYAREDQLRLALAGLERETRRKPRLASTAEVHGYLDRALTGLTPESRRLVMVGFLDRVSVWDVLVRLSFGSALSSRGEALDRQFAARDFPLKSAPAPTRETGS
jgi:hypothetical protein